MLENNGKNDLIYAYALGCLDQDEVIKFKDNVLHNENFAWDELGEFQNLTALMTSILAVEIPKPEVKEKVAEKLYNLKNEVPPETQLPETAENFEPIEEKESENLFEPELEINDNELPEHQEMKTSTFEGEIIDASNEEPSTEIEKLNEEIPTESFEKIDENELEQNENLKDDFFTNTENQNEEFKLENEKNENEINENEVNLNDENNNAEDNLENKNETEIANEEINIDNESLAGEEDLTDKNNLPFDLTDDFLPKRKEPEKFRFEEVDNSQNEKLSQNFIEKFIEQNKSSITEKIDKTIEGLKEQFGNEPIVDEAGYELVQPISKNLSILNSRNSDLESTDLNENTEHSLVTDSLKSQELQRVFIQKGSGTKVPLIIVSILTLLILAAAAYFYMNFKEIIKTNNQEIAQLKNDSATLYSSKQTSHAVISFLESPNVTTVELGSTDAAPNSSGKLYINFATGTGYLYTKNLPVLEGGNSLQLWLSSGGKFISLGVINSKGDDEYYPFNFKPINETRNTEILVTEENSDGAKQPSSKLLLIGALE